MQVDGWQWNWWLLPQNLLLTVASWCRAHQSRPLRSDSPYPLGRALGRTAIGSSTSKRLSLVGCGVDLAQGSAVDLTAAKRERA
jgi:hypothetical protein